MKKILFGLLILFTIFFVGCNSEPAEWVTNIEQAILTAEETDKDLLIFFSGIPWDNISEQYYNDILSSESFLKEVGKAFVPVQLNIVIDESTLTEEEISINQTNYMIASSLGVTNVPLVYTTSPDGIPYGYIVFNQNDSTLDSVIKQVKSLISTKNNIGKLKGKLEKATGVEKAKIIDELYHSVPEVFSYQFYDLITEFPELDPENETGKLGEFKLLLAYEQAVVLFNESGDVNAAAKIFIDLAESGLLNKEEYQYAYYTAASLESYNGEIITENTLPYLQKAYDAAPTSDIADSISQTITAIEAIIAESTTGENQ